MSGKNLIASAVWWSPASTAIKGCSANWLNGYCPNWRQRHKPQYQTMVSFLRQDIRTELPGGEFDLILCRNLVFTYFDEALQLATLERIMTRLRPGGWLLLGVHESLPANTSGLKAVSERLGLYHYE